MDKLLFGFVTLIGGAVLLAAQTAAESRFITEEAVVTIEKRQAAMARMLEAVEQVVPRLGANRTTPVAMNPSHWPLIRKEIETTRAFLAESEKLWGPPTN